MKPTWEIVTEDMHERDQVGRNIYGIPLKPFNGRESLKDAYEEALDLAVYLKNQQIEDKARRTQVVELYQETLSGTLSITQIAEKLHELSGNGPIQEVLVINDPNSYAKILKIRERLETLTMDIADKHLGPIEIEDRLNEILEDFILFPTLPIGEMKDGNIERT